jgi:hypothetical protein
MSISGILRRKPVLALELALALGFSSDRVGRARIADARSFTLLGTQAWGPQYLLKNPMQGPRISVFETDTWRHSLVDGSLTSVPQLPLPNKPWKSDLLRGAHFTPDAYLDQIAGLQNTYCRQRDILMYYGGVRRHPSQEGLNFNGWSGHDLRRLRALKCRPFIGLETMDRVAVRTLIWRLKEAGYGPLDRIYIRIGAEPAYSSYKPTPESYRRAFAATAEYINGLNRRLRLNIHTVFAGANGKDFSRYLPPEYLFDSIGYDLYVTPENKTVALSQLRTLARRYPYKTLVIPEFGIATQGLTGEANPGWAADALGDVLTEFSRHPAGVEEITVFSVNVPARMTNRRWSWAWTPRMYEMLKEWQANPRHWKKDGFHRYDPLSYPANRDILFLNRPDLKVVYRKSGRLSESGQPLFQETRLFLQEGIWERDTRTVYFAKGETKIY